MSSVTSGPVNRQTSAASVPRMAAWFGEVTLIARQRAHWRLSWSPRLARNAASASQAHARIHLYGIPPSISSVLNLAMPLCSTISQAVWPLQPSLPPKLPRAKLVAHLMGYR